MEGRCSECKKKGRLYARGKCYHCWNAEYQRKLRRGEYGDVVRKKQKVQPDNKEVVVAEKEGQKRASGD